MAIQAVGLKSPAHEQSPLKRTKEDAHSPTPSGQKGRLLYALRDGIIGFSWRSKQTSEPALIHPAGF
jgi:hypothetical protein